MLSQSHGDLLLKADLTCSAGRVARLEAQLKRLLWRLDSCGALWAPKVLAWSCTFSNAVYSFFQPEELAMSSFPPRQPFFF